MHDPGRHSAAQSTAPAYKDPKLPVEARVEDLLARMTLEEKVAQMLSIWENKADVFDARLEFDPAKMALKYPNGIGTFARPSDATGPSSPRVVRRRDVPGTIRLVNALQHYAMTGTRLGIPILLHEEGLHGYAARRRHELSAGHRAGLQLGSRPWCGRSTP